LFLKKSCFSRLLVMDTEHNSLSDTLNILVSTTGAHLPCGFFDRRRMLTFYR
jgi:hypothetical protein